MTPLVSVTRLGNIQGPASGVVADFYSLFEGSTWTDNGKWEYQTGQNPPGITAANDLFLIAADAGAPGGRYWYSRPNGVYTNVEVFQALNSVVSQGPPAPAIGEVVSWRHFTYINSNGFGVADGDYHSLGFGDDNNLNSGPFNGGMIWTWLDYASLPGVIGPGDIAQRINTVTSSQSAPYETPNSAPGSLRLVMDEWMRFEYNWTRVGSTTYSLALRVYDAADVQLLDQDDMLENNAGGPDNLSDDVITIASTDQVRCMQIGIPGLDTGTWDVEMERHAAFAAITDSVAHTDMAYGYFSHES